MPPSAIAIVGAGLAGLRTVAHLRRNGYTGRLVLLGAEEHLPYDRPPLSKHVLRGESDVVWLHPPNDYGDLDVEVRLGHRVRSVDIVGQRLHTEHGEVGYEALVIATGALPRRVPGLDGHVLRTLDDAYELRTALRPGTHLAVIGAGLVGCEVAASARTLGVSVDLIDVLGGPLVRVVGETVAARVAELHREHGVGLHFGTSATRCGAGPVRLSDGAELDVDVVLEAVGAVPDTGWLEDSGLSLRDGVVCDESGRAAENVYAVGDVARWAGVRNEHWTSAVDQAARVAATIVGVAPPSDSVPYWWSDQYDIKLQGLGQPAADDDVQMLSWGPKARPLALYSRDGQLTGGVGFSAARAVMSLRSDIVQGSAVDDVAARLLG